MVVVELGVEEEGGEAGVAVIAGAISLATDPVMLLA